MLSPIICRSKYHLNLFGRKAGALLNNTNHHHDSKYSAQKRSPLIKYLKTEYWRNKYTFYIFRFELC